MQGGDENLAPPRHMEKFSHSFENREMQGGDDNLAPPRRSTRITYTANQMRHLEKSEFSKKPFHRKQQCSKTFVAPLPIHHGHSKKFRRQCGDSFDVPPCNWETFSLTDSGRTFPKHGWHTRMSGPLRKPFPKHRSHLRPIYLRPSIPPRTKFTRSQMESSRNSVNVISNESSTSIDCSDLDFLQMRDSISTQISHETKFDKIAVKPCPLEFDGTQLAI